MKKFYLFILATMIAVNAFGYEKQTWNYETGAKLSIGASGVHALDIYYPETGEGSYPVFIWLGANMGNGGVSKESAYSYASVLIDTVLQRGYAVVVPNSHYEGEDNQLLPLNDSKAVIRFLRNNGEGMSEYPQNIDTSFIAIGGFDADGLIATMMGGKNWIAGGAELEGTVGNFLDKSSSVDAVASWAGIYTSLGNLANFERMVFDRWLRGSTSESWDASRFTMVSIATLMSDPAPTVLFHGSHDGVVKQADVEWFYAYLQDRLGDDSEYYLMNGVGHSLITISSKYYYYGYMVNFLDRIRAKKVTTDIDQITNDQSQITNKVIKDGRLLINRNGKTYNLQGAVVR